MNRIRTLLFPILMLAGLVLSAFVIVTCLQAAADRRANSSADKTVSGASAQDLVTRGRGLFLAKGCLVCHRYDGLAQERDRMMEFSFDDVPNLTNLTVNADYLRRWLRDPKAIKPSTTMPTLNLSNDEIEALVGFLTTKN